MVNDTIARCFHQSGGVIRTVDGATYTYTDEGFDYEKFAKLIILECCNDMVQCVEDKSLSGQVEGVLYKLIKNVTVHFTDYLKTKYGMKELASW